MTRTVPLALLLAVPAVAAPIPDAERDRLAFVTRYGEWTVRDGSYRIEGYYEDLLPFLAREQVEEGLQYEGTLPTLPRW